MGLNDVNCVCVCVCVCVCMFAAVVRGGCGGGRGSSN